MASWTVTLMNGSYLEHMTLSIYLVGSGLLENQTFFGCHRLHCQMSSSIRRTRATGIKTNQLKLSLSISNLIIADNIFSLESCVKQTGAIAKDHLYRTAYLCFCLYIATVILVDE